MTAKPISRTGRENSPVAVFVNGLRIDSRGPVNRPCFAYQAAGMCARGSACRFVHDATFPIEPARQRASVAAAQSALPTSLRVARQCSIDTDLAARLTALVRAALGLDPMADLAALHTSPEGVRAVSDSERGRNNELQKRWTHALSKRGSAWRVELESCMRSFVSRDVAAAVDAAAHGYSALCYQAEPSLRLHLPHAKCGIQLHKDADYFHQPNEINLWLPLSTGVGGSNSLYVESAPGVGDYTALEVGVGFFHRFWGNQCAHHTVVNTSDVTRVSLDVRVVPMELFDDAWPSPQGHVSFRLSEYYEQVACEAEGGASSRLLALPDDTLQHLCGMVADALVPRGLVNLAAACRGARHRLHTNVAELREAHRFAQCAAQRLQVLSALVYV